MGKAAVGRSLSCHRSPRPGAQHRRGSRRCPRLARDVSA